MNFSEFPGFESLPLRQFFSNRLEWADGPCALAVDAIDKMRYHNEMVGM